MKRYQVFYFLLGMAISLEKSYCFIFGGSNYGTPESTLGHIFTWTFALAVGFLMASAATWYYNDKESLKARAAARVAAKTKA